MAKYTNGNEYVVVATNKDYKGIYNIGPNGSFFTGKTYIFGESKVLNAKLIVEKKDQAIIEYEELNTKLSQTSFATIVSFFPSPSDKEYEAEIITRYFVRRANDRSMPIIEINDKQFNKRNAYYNYVSLKWKIAGNNISSYNEQQISEAEETLAGISLALSNLIQLSLRKKDNII